MRTLVALPVLSVLSLCLPFCTTIVGAEPPEDLEAGRFLRGDVNGDWIVSQADIFSLIRYFQTGRLPACADAADVDDSGAIGIPDLISVVAFLYWKGQPPAPPYRFVGSDPTADALGCEQLQGRARLVGNPEKVAGGDEDDGHVIDFIEFYSRMVEAYPGESGIRIPILMTNIRDIDGFTVCVRADPSRIWLDSIDLPRYMPGRLKPEFQPLFLDRRVEGYVGRSIFMDYGEPFEGNVLQRSQGATVAYLVFGVSPEAQLGEKLWITFEDIPPESEFRPAPFNEFSADGQSYRPQFDLGGLEVRIVSRNLLFVRGDPNGDSAINITDMITILRYLFIGESLICLDPADVDDTGAVDISDVISLAEHLFGAGTPLRQPYPNPGRDPTPDVLGQCQ